MKKVAVSVHDVTPFFSRELDIIFEGLDKAGVRDRSELVTPDFRRKTKIEAGSAFAARMLEHQKNGADISLHGIHHEYAEFYRFNYEEARDAIRQGMEIFSEALGFKPAGFVAPQWLQSRGSLRAVQEAGFFYTSLMTSVRFQDGRVFKAFPFNYDWGLSIADSFMSWRNGILCGLRREGLIRFSMHPMDVPHGRLEAEMDHLRRLLDKGWEPVSYLTLGKEKSDER